MNPRLLPAVVLVVLAGSGCGLKGPLYLPEKSDVTIRPAPAATAPEAPAEAAPAAEPEAAPEPAAKPEPPPQDASPGPDRG
jgi:predicted small lipoprotein YifL